jgi:hypothetical protein
MDPVRPDRRTGVDHQPVQEVRCRVARPVARLATKDADALEGLERAQLLLGAYDVRVKLLARTGVPSTSAGLRCP